MRLVSLLCFVSVIFGYEYLSPAVSDGDDHCRLHDNDRFQCSTTVGCSYDEVCLGQGGTGGCCLACSNIFFEESCTSSCTPCYTPLFRCVEVGAPCSPLTTLASTFSTTSKPTPTPPPAPTPTPPPAPTATTAGLTVIMDPPQNSETLPSPTTQARPSMDNTPGDAGAGDSSFATQAPSEAPVSSTAGTSSQAATDAPQSSSPLGTTSRSSDETLFDPADAAASATGDDASVANKSGQASRTLLFAAVGGVSLIVCCAAVLALVLLRRRRRNPSPAKGASDNGGASGRAAAPLPSSAGANAYTVAPHRSRSRRHSVTSRSRGVSMRKVVAPPRPSDDATGSYELGTLKSAQAQLGGNVYAPGPTATPPSSARYEELALSSRYASSELPVSPGYTSVPDQYTSAPREQAATGYSAVPSHYGTSDVPAAGYTVVPDQYTRPSGTSSKRTPVRPSAPNLAAPPTLINTYSAVGGHYVGM